MAQTIDQAFCTIPEAAESLRVSVSTVWRWINSGRLVAYRVGQRRIRIKKEDLATMVRPIHEESEAKMAKTREQTQMFRMSPREANDQVAVVKRARALQEEILRRRGGELLPPSWEDINEAREERSAGL